MVRQLREGSALNLRVVDRYLGDGAVMANLYLSFDFLAVFFVVESQQRMLGLYLRYFHRI